MSDEKMMPCKFCGVTPKPHANWTHPETWGCRCHCPDRQYATEAEAIAAWNKQAALAHPPQARDVAEVRIVERIPLYPLGKGGLRVVMEANGHRFEMECHAWPGSDAYVQFEQTIAALAALPLGEKKA